VNEEPPHVLGTHGCQCLTHRLDQSLLAAGADLPEDVLDLREGFFYRVEVRGVGRQVDELAPPLLDELPYPFWPVRFKRLSITTI
jgi:hypothetical protein